MATETPVPCGVMVSNDPRARCTKESDHDGPCDFVPDRHAATKEGSGEAPAGYVECAYKCGRWTDGGLCWACFWKGHATAAEQANLSAAANGNPDWTPATPPTGDPAATPTTAADLPDDHDDKPLGLTFVIVQPRIVTMRYGNCVPRTPDDIAFTKKLRASTWDACQKIGAPESE